jgi:hypothetical protein
MTPAPGDPPDPDDALAEVVRLELSLLDPRCAHRPERVTWRSSVWVRGGERRWLLRYRQGTAAPPSQAQGHPALDQAE